MEKKLTITSKKYAGETTVVSLRMPEALIKKLDEICAKTGRTRNDLIIKSLDFALENVIIEGEEK